MSRENAEIARRIFEEFNATQGEVGHLTGPDFLFVASTFRGWPDEPEYVGLDGFQQFLAKWTAPYEEWEVELQEIREAHDGRVVLLGRQRGRVNGSAAWVELLWGQILTIAGGVVARGEIYASHAEALEAAGLSE